ncbi:MAG: hypothetical protein NZM17_10790 [Pyrinomonadaceae bacterium]|nr:hypothetical protein [Pyrinomonadaceae bacterium]
MFVSRQKAVAKRRQIRDSGRCLICKSRRDLEFHHRQYHFLCLLILIQKAAGYDSFL